MAPITCSGDSAASAARKRAPAELDCVISISLLAAPAHPCGRGVSPSLDVKCEGGRWPPSFFQSTQQMRHAGALFFELGEGLVHHGAAVVVDGQARHHL